MESRIPNNPQPNQKRTDTPSTEDIHTLQSEHQHLLNKEYNELKINFKETHGKAIRTRKISREEKLHLYRWALEPENKKSKKDRCNCIEWIDETFEEEDDELNLSTYFVLNPPPYLEKMKWLTSLTLRSNGLREFPAKWCQLLNLTYLDLSENEIVSLPEGIIYLKKATIYLNDNPLDELECSQILKLIDNEKSTVKLDFETDPLTLQYTDVSSIAVSSSDDENDNPEKQDDVSFPEPTEQTKEADPQGVRAGIIPIFTPKTLAELASTVSQNVSQPSEQPCQVALPIPTVINHNPHQDFINSLIDLAGKSEPVTEQFMQELSHILQTAPVDTIGRLEALYHQLSDRPEDEDFIINQEFLSKLTIRIFLPYLKNTNIHRSVYTNLLEKHNSIQSIVELLTHTEEQIKHHEFLSRNPSPLEFMEEILIKKRIMKLKELINSSSKGKGKWKQSESKEKVSFTCKYLYYKAVFLQRFNLPDYTSDMLFDTSQYTPRASEHEYFQDQLDDVRLTPEDLIESDDWKHLLHRNFRLAQPSQTQYRELTEDLVDDFNCKLSKDQPPAKKKRLSESQS